MLSPQIATPEQVKKTGLEYRFYAPPAEGPRPIVLLVHGRTGTSSVMWPFAKAVHRFKPIILAPQAPTSDVDGGYSWWQVRRQDSAQGGVPRTPAERLAECEAAVSVLKRFLAAAAELHHGDLTQVYAMGFSQGAGLSAATSILHPGTFRGVALLAGFIPEIVCQTEEQRALDQCQAETTRYFIAHGSEDRILPIERAYQAERFLRGRGADVELVTEGVGHKVGAEGIRALATWFERIWENG